MFKNIASLKSLLLLTSVSLLSAQLAAQPTPTPEQIKQFKMLPKTQQQALAKQYGLPLDQMMAAGSVGLEEYEPSQLVQPREVQPRPQAHQQLEFNKENKLQPYGYSLFAGKPSTFAPLSDIQIPADYKLGPGDSIHVQLFGKESGTYDLRVNRRGMINFPDLGPVAVAGMSFSELKTAITQRIKNQLIGVQSNVTLGELRAIRVFVLGEAWQPGPYTVSALSSMTQLLYFSGGLSENGSLRNIQLKRRGRVIGTLDLYSLLVNGDTKNDLRLQSGDVVFIPPVGNTVSIDGEIRRPAIYEMKHGETLSKLISYAGGVLPTAYADTVTIEGFDKAKNRIVLTKNINTKQGKNYKVLNGQKVFIPEVAEHFDSYVQLLGDLVRPGRYQWHKGMRINELLRSIQGDLSLSTDLNYALIVREKNRQRDIEVLQFQPANAILEPGSQDNLELQPRDRIVLLNRYNFSDLMALDSLRENNSDLLSYSQAKNKQNQEDVEAQEKSQFVSDEELRQYQQVRDDAQVPEKYEIFTANEWAILDDVSRISGFSKDQLKHIKETSRSSLLASILVQLKAQGSYDELNGFVEIVGEVKHPGFYPLSDKRDLKSLLRAAGGLNGAAFTLAAELSRVTHHSGEDAKTEVVTIDLSQELKGGSEMAVTLSPKDRLNIFSIPNFKKNRKIVLQGGHATGAVFTRKALQLKEQELLNSYSSGLRQEIAKSSLRADRMGAPLASSEQSMAFIDEMTSTKAMGRMVINLDAILAGEKGSDFLLEDGDFLYIPPFRDSITIMGEVQYGTSYLFDDSLDLNDYISRAGGPKKQADEDRIYVVRADGSVDTPGTGYWFDAEAIDLRPGDTIVVPVDTHYRDLLSTWTSATQMLYQIGIAVNAIK